MFKFLTIALFIVGAFLAGVLAHKHCPWVQNVVGPEEIVCVCPCKQGCCK